MALQEMAGNNFEAGIATRHDGWAAVCGAAADSRSARPGARLRAAVPRRAGGMAFRGDGDLATRTMLDNTVMFGLEKLTGGLPAFVNCTAEALTERTGGRSAAQHDVLGDS
jgi:hypothetical protein